MDYNDLLVLTGERDDVGYYIRANVEKVTGQGLSLMVFSFLMITLRLSQYYI